MPRLEDGRSSRVATFSWETFPEGRGLTIRAPKGPEAAYFAARNAKRLDLNFEPI
ncbi:MAG: hypothetical protein IKX88_15525 [Thermoguttaceae bacterium]|nr:hypothetical protein [Thermoguttaceae bacterium]